MKFLRNCWYVAGWGDEVQPGKPLGRKLLNEPVVLFRDSTGRPHALFDRCPHRFVPLHLGKVAGDSLQCPYHGLEFSGNGNCTRNPHGNGAIPGGARVKSYPVVERESVLWIWMGAEEKADAALIPKFERMDPESWFVGKGYLHARSNYQLDVDNIMDLSHIDYLHPGTLGSASSQEAETEVTQAGNTVYSRRLVKGERLSEELERRNGYAPGTLVDRWLDVRWEAPGVMELVVGNVPSGAENPRQSGRQLFFFHLFTPETESTAHYWFATSKPVSSGDEGRSWVSRGIEFLKAPFEHEDLPMLEAQQRSMGDASLFWDMKPVLLVGDGGAVRARRVLDAMILAEQS